SHGLLPVQSVGVSPTDPPRLYPNHPPFIPLLVAGSYAVFGVGEWQMRLPSFLFTLAALGMLYAMTLHRAGLRAAVLVGSCYLIAPITIRYAGHPDVINAQLVFFILLSTAAYLRLHKAPGMGNLLLLMAA